MIRLIIVAFCNKFSIKKNKIELDNWSDPFLISKSQIVVIQIYFRLLTSFFQL